MSIVGHLNTTQQHTDKNNGSKYKNKLKTITL